LPHNEGSKFLITLRVDVSAVCIQEVEARLHSFLISLVGGGGVQLYIPIILPLT